MQALPVDPDTDNTKMAASTHCRLLELPAGLQLLICELAVIEPNSIAITCPYPLYFFTNGGPSGEAHEIFSAPCKHLHHRGKLQPNISRTCKQLRATVLPIYYGHNTFEAQYCEVSRQWGLSAWENSLALAEAAFIKRLFVHVRRIDTDLASPTLRKRTSINELGLLKHSHAFWRLNGSIGEDVLEEGDYDRLHVTFGPATD